MTEATYPVLVFPGALGVVDGGSAASLFGQRRVLTFSYGEETEIEPLLQRAVELMTAAGARHFDVIGFSVGGWFAQCLSARHPDLVRRLVLAHSFTLDRSDAWRFGLASKLWPLLPTWLIHSAIQKRAKMALAGLRRVDPGRYEVTIKRLSEAFTGSNAQTRLLAQQLATCDSLLHMVSCLPRQPVLIVDSNDDPIIGRRSREKLRRRFPTARRVILQGAGHVSSLSAPEALTTAVYDFLNA